tara:strand:- start:94 stop:1866 length:1773 start_codon:yes stop_codon:yes gene_type:complete
MKYRSEIDGLRALAVVPVILFHAGFQFFKGGFIGVDVFFVISGYLITSIIIYEINQKKFNILNFYERRIRRILPALFFVIILNIPFALLFMLPDPLENFGQSLIATTFFSNNILLYLTSGYWDLASEFKPLLHTWSLAVEEQYYIIFPILMILISNWRLKLQLLLFLTLFLLSLYVAEININNGGSFYLLHTRAFEILIGVFSAFFLIKKGFYNSKVLNESLSLLGIIMIFISIFIFDDSTPFPGIYSLIPTIGTCLIILFAVKDTFVNNFLSKKIFIQIGLVSYSAYLFHQSIFSYMRIISVNEPSNLLLFFGIVLTFLLAYLSFQFVEKPFRDKTKIDSKKLFIYLFIPFLLIISLGSHITINNGYIEKFYGENFNKLEKSKIISQRAYNFSKNEFINEDMLNVLIIGNSFGRDIINVVLETYNQNHYELIYSNEYNDCSLNRNFLVDKVIAQSDLIIMGSDFSDKNCIDQLIKKAKKLDKAIFFVGAKHFGNNLNWIRRINLEDRNNLRNEIPENTLTLESKLKLIVPSDNFISYIENLSNEGKIIVTDDNGNLISDDRQHLTLSGVKYVGENVFKRNSSLSSYFEE